MSEGWKRCSHKLQCPSCGHDHGCQISACGSAVMCLRSSDPNAYTLANGMGKLVQLRNGKRQAIRKLVGAKPDKKMTRAEIEARLKVYRNQCSSEHVARASESLGISQESLRAFGIGYNYESGTLTFPMLDGFRRPIGIQWRYLNSSKKLTEKGSTNGLFIATDYGINYGLSLDTRGLHRYVLICLEGMSDAATARDLGFASIGRPSNSGGAEQMCVLLDACPANERPSIVMIADHDPVKYMKDGVPFWPGWEGSLSIAQHIVSRCKSLSIMKPPEGKDLRSWRLAGGTSEELYAAIGESRLIDPTWIASEKSRLDDWKKRLKKKPQFKREVSV